METRQREINKIPDQSKSAMTLLGEGDAIFDRDVKVARERYLRAQEQVHSCADVAWLRAAIYFSLGKCYEKEGRFQEAHDEYKKAIDESPKDDREIPTSFYIESRNRMTEKMESL